MKVPTVTSGPVHTKNCTTMQPRDEKIVASQQTKMK